MDREKQIEEIAKVIHKGEFDRNKGVLDCTEFTTDLVIKLGLQRLAEAKALYNAGYCKQSEVVKEIIGEILLNHTPDIDGFFIMHESELAKIKKKYTGESENVVEC